MRTRKAINIIYCVTCGRMFEVWDYELKNGRKFCSQKCKRYSKETRKKISDSRKGLLVGEENPAKRIEVREKISKKLFGKEKSSDAKKNMSIAQRKSQSNRDGNALKENASYRAVHYWVESKLGKANICSICDRRKSDGFKIEWASKSHKAHRDINDYLQLCSRCHGIYDRGTRKRRTS